MNYEIRSIPLYYRHSRRIGESPYRCLEKAYADFSTKGATG